MEYHPDYKLPAAFRADKPALPLNRYLAAKGLTQFHSAETEKYSHVTYYFNGGMHEKAPGEEHVMLPSPKVSTYDLMPEMATKPVNKYLPPRRQRSPAEQGAAPKQLDSVEDVGGFLGWVDRVLSGNAAKEG